MAIMKYRKKPVVVETMQYFEQEHVALLNFAHNMVYKPDGLYIPTLEGDMKISPGDYVIKGVKGEFYPCKPDIFKMTYEKVDDAD